MDEKFVPGQGIENEEETVMEEVNETVEEADGVLENFVDNEEINEEVSEETLEDEKEEAVQPKNGYKTSAIIAWVLVAILALADVYYYMTNIYNKYNHMGYLNTNGYTIGDAVAGMGMDFDEFKEMYGLPKDMRKDTYMNAAQSLIPISKMAELNNIDFETLKTEYNFGEEITEDSTWGEAIDTMQLKDYVGEENLDEFKEQYGFGDEITLETKWGDIRKKVEKLQVEKREAEKTKNESNEDDSSEIDNNDLDETSEVEEESVGSETETDSEAAAE